LAHINKLYSTCSKLEEGETSFTTCPEDNYENKHTFSAAKIAVDATLTGVDSLLNPTDHSVSKSYAIVRPPGHHAHEEIHSGFCFFNNVAIAAMHASKLGKKVLIFDWDIHQGDGT